MEIQLNYSKFKERVLTSKRCLHQHNLSELGSDKYYMLFASEENVLYLCSINTVNHSSDVTDYETNYISGNNGNYPANKNIKLKNAQGADVTSPTFEDTLGLYPKKKMYKHLITASTINFHDTLVSTEKKICGGEYWISEDDIAKVHNDDYLEFSIIDKDDVLGLFTTYGLTVGVDILELTKFIQTDYVKKGKSADGYHSRLYEGIIGTNTVYAGLYMRVAYDSSGTQDLNFLWRMYYYE